MLHIYLLVCFSSKVERTAEIVNNCNPVYKWKCRDGSHTCIQLDFQKHTGGSWVHRGWVRQRSPADCGTRSQSPPGWRSPSTTWSTRYRSLRTAPPTVARWASASVGDVLSWTASCAEGIKAAMIAHTWHPFSSKRERRLITNLPCGLVHRIEGRKNTQ